MSAQPLQTNTANLKSVSDTVVQPSTLDSVLIPQETQPATTIPDGDCSRRSDDSTCRIISKDSETPVTVIEEETNSQTLRDVQEENKGATTGPESKPENLKSTAVWSDYDTRKGLEGLEMMLALRPPAPSNRHKDQVQDSSNVDVFKHIEDVLDGLKYLDSALAVMERNLQEAKRLIDAL